MKQLLLLRSGNQIQAYWKQTPEGRKHNKTASTFPKYFLSKSTKRIVKFHVIPISNA